MPDLVGTSPGFSVDCVSAGFTLKRRRSENAALTRAAGVCIFIWILSLRLFLIAFRVLRRRAPPGKGTVQTDNAHRDQRPPLANNLARRSRSQARPRYWERLMGTSLARFYKIVSPASRIIQPDRQPPGHPYGLARGIPGPVLNPETAQTFRRQHRRCLRKEFTVIGFLSLAR